MTGLSLGSVARGCKSFFEKSGTRHWLGVGDPEKALPELNKAVELSPTSAGVYEARGNAATALHQWERAIADFANARTLRGRLTQGPGATPLGDISPRSPGADSRCLDLGPVFNGALTPGWFIPSEPETSMGLPALPRGLVEFDGVPFELRGVVQLAGREFRQCRATFPRTIQGISLPPLSRRVHFLHGAETELTNGTLDQLNNLPASLRSFRLCGVLRFAVNQPLFHP